MSSQAIPAWFGYVSGQGALRLEDKDGFRRHLDAFKGQEIEIAVRQRRTKRSLDQNRWLWGVALPLIAEHCGYDHHEHERLHYDLLSVRFGTTAVPPLLPGAPPRIEPAKTSSDLTTVEFSEYMDWLVRYAAEQFGVVIPLPSEVAA